MIQEYLFFDDTHREAVEKYAPAKVTVDIFDIENSTCWIVTYSAPHENEDTAKLLSQVNEHVVGNFCPTVLTNESSAYFNKKLYPYINEFERKLRKLLFSSPTVSLKPSAPWKPSWKAWAIPMTTVWSASG